MKIAKCSKCGARFLRIDGMKFDDTTGVLTQLTLCPECGHTVVTKWALTTAEKIGFGIALGVLFGDEKPQRVKGGVAIYEHEKELPLAMACRDKLDRLFPKAKTVAPAKPKAKTTAKRKGRR